MTAKKIIQQSQIGQQGVNLVEGIVLEMGYVWRPTPNADAGIDGTIEIRDATTGEVKNAIVQVQIKATTRPFQAETVDVVEYNCDANDLQYWLQGNVPVLLIVCRPATREAYWVSVKDYFKDPSIRKGRKISFDKNRDRFDRTSAPALARLGLPRDVGVFFAPPPKRERLYSNLLRVTSFPGKLYISATDFRLSKDLWAKFNVMGVRPGSEYVLTDKQIISFHDLTQHPWNAICDSGGQEVFDSGEWAFTDDVDRRHVFTRLLKQCLKEKARTLDLRYDRSQGYYHFLATPGRKPQRVSYRGNQSQVKRTVFKGYFSKKNTGRVAYYRHTAFHGDFDYLGGDWYLEITPTYHFTWNGRDLDNLHEERLAGIKRLERNPAVLALVLMWAEYLSQPDDLYRHYPFLTFGELASFEVDVGINDRAWLDVEDDDEKQTLSDEDNQLPLLET